MIVNRVLLSISFLLLFLNISLSQNKPDFKNTRSDDPKDIPSNRKINLSNRTPNTTQGTAGNSEKMTGTVSVAIFFVESNGSIDSNSYTWTFSDENIITDQIQTALSFWSAEASKYGRTLNYQISSYSASDPRCQQGYEPITHRYFEKNLWIDPIMTNFGYPTGSTINRINNFNSNLRTINHTDWAFSIFVCYNPAPASTTFTDGFSIMSYYYGPCFQLLYRNGDCPVSESHNIIAFAIGEIFGALMECANCNQNEYSRSIPNTNCEIKLGGLPNTNSVDCIMKNKTIESGVCSFTAAHIGWIDTPPVHTIVSSPPGLRIRTTRTGATGTEVNITPKNFGWGAGQTVNLTTDSFQILNSVNYTFLNWSDNGPINHDIIVSNVKDTIKAFFISPPGFPVLLFPLNDTMNCPLTQTLVWDSVATALSYRLQVSTDTNFISIFYERNNLTSTSQSISELQNATTYYWRVNATNISGTGAWSTVSNFTTKVAAPNLVSPMNNTTGISVLPELTWNSIGGTLFYKIQLSTHSNFSGIYFEKDSLTTVFTPPNSLSKNVKYYWRIKTFGVKGASDWSEIWNFTTVNTTATCFCNSNQIIYDSSGFLSPSTDYPLNLSNKSTLDNLVITSIYFDFETSVFKILDNCPIIIPPGGNYSLSIRFNPDSVGIFNNTLHILNSSGNNPHIVLPVSGIVVGTSIAINPSFIDFGNIGYGADPFDTTITIKNTGYFPLKIDSIKFQGMPIYEFSPSIDFTKINIKPNESFALTIRINTNQLGLKNSAILILNNSANLPSIAIPLTYNVVMPALSFSPETIYYDSTSIETPDIKKTLTIRNPTANRININNLNIIDDTVSFSVYSGVKKPFLLPGESDSIVIKFAPHSKGLKKAILKINTDDILLPVRKIYLYGVGGGKPIFSSDQNNIDFGRIPVGESVQKKLFFTNNGNLNLDILRKSIGGKDKDIFSILSDRPYSLSSRQSDSITFILAASLPVGERSAKLELSTNDNLLSSVNIDLLCNITSPIISTSFKSIDFQQIEPNTLKDTTFTLYNTGNSPLRITKIFIDGPNAADFFTSADPLPFTLNINESKKIKISFKPISFIESVARIAIISNDPINPEFSVIMKGSGSKAIKPKISCSTLELNFGSVNNNESKPMNLIIYNLGSADLDLDSIYLTGSHKKHFHLSSSLIPQQIKPLDSAKIEIVFLPENTDSINQFHSTLRIVSNDSSNRLIEINLYACISSGNILLSDTILNFGKVIIMDSSERKFSISNPNEFAISIDSIYFDRINDSPFSLKTVKPAFINKNTKIECSIIFYPKNKKYYSAKLNILAGQNNMKKIFIEGYTIAPVFSTKRPLDFGKVPQDSNTTTKIIISNSGDALLHIKSIFFIGKDSAEFSVSNRIFPISILPDSEDTLYITFSPKSAGKKACKIKLTINDPFDSGEIDISAEAISKAMNICSTLTPSYFLLQNYPNPFNPETKIEYSIPKYSYVTLIMYNCLGQEVEKPVNEYQQAGTYFINWNPKDLPGGIYYLRLSTSTYNSIKKMVYLK
jgi:hypothetical protein